jgi:putative CocE/NonD family hydrolase
MKTFKVNDWVVRLGLAGAGLYIIRRQIFALLLRAPMPTHQVSVTRGARIPMPDGETLAADLYLPHGNDRLPTVLIRTPYTRSGSLFHPLVFYSQRFAERGFNVICQDVRGTHDSGKDFQPFLHEVDDGGATLEWIAQQPWSDGNVGMWGESYVGYTQWAGAASGSQALKALFPMITDSQLVEFPGDGLHMDTLLRWMLTLDALSDPNVSAWQRLRRLTDSALQDRLLADAFMHLPLTTVDEVFLRRPQPFYREVVGDLSPDHPYWTETNLAEIVPGAPPAHFVSGWYDIFLDGLLRDYSAQLAAGKQPYLTVGPWTHMDSRLTFSTFQEAVGWFSAYLKGDRRWLRRDPVRIFVMGADRWRSFASWPPPTFTTRYFLGGVASAHAGALFPDSPPPRSAPDHYRFDPANPTPSIGGPLLATKAGARDNRPLETRSDLLVYTSLPLSQPLEAIGPVRLELFVQSSTPHTDFFGRLCDVHPDGRSINICEGHVRLTPGAGEQQPDGSLRIEIELGATAHQFQRAHRIRLHVCSGAHPRIARNLGTGEPINTATRMVVADQTVFHDAAHPSALVLPLMTW